jgi:hypothetical protein
MRTSIQEHPYITNIHIHMIDTVYSQHHDLQFVWAVSFYYFCSSRIWASACFLAISALTRNRRNSRDLRDSLFGLFTNARRVWHQEYDSKVEALPYPRQVILQAGLFESKRFPLFGSFGVVVVVVDIDKEKSVDRLDISKNSTSAQISVVVVLLLHC